MCSLHARASALTDAEPAYKVPPDMNAGKRGLLGGVLGVLLALAFIIMGNLVATLIHR